MSIYDLDAAEDSARNLRDTERAEARRTGLDNPPPPTGWAEHDWPPSASEIAREG
jgi:hypothetical protein